jgi:hypothetical protein
LETDKLCLSGKRPTFKVNREYAVVGAVRIYHRNKKE